MHHVKRQVVEVVDWVERVEQVESVDDEAVQDVRVQSEVVQVRQADVDVRLLLGYEEEHDLQKDRLQEVDVHACRCEDYQVGNPEHDWGNVRSTRLDVH